MAYHVRRPEDPPPRWPVPVAIAVVACAALAAMYASYAPYPITIDGRAGSVPAFARAAELAGSGSIAAAPGDLLAVDGSVVEEGAGEPLLVERDDQPLPDDARVYPGDVLHIAPGADIIEPTVTTETVIEAPVVEIGSGPLEQLVDEGRSGTAVVEYGAVSGIEVSRTVLTEPVPARVARSGGTGRLRVVALTFDDGPVPGQTEHVLRILREQDVKATFFMLGNNVQRYPAWAKMVVADGHEIGNHTYSHRTNSGTTREQARAEIGSAQTVIRKVTGVEAAWFRPPGGMMGRHMYAEARSQGLRIAMWGVDPWDWSGKTDRQVTDAVVKAVKPGSIVLLHDGGGDRRATIWALGPMITRLKAAGYTFVTLDELADIQAAQAARR